LLRNFITDEDEDVEASPKQKMPESRPMIKTQTPQNKIKVERMETPTEKQQKNKSPNEKQQQQNKTPSEKQQQKNKTPSEKLHLKNKTLNEKRQQGAIPKSSRVTPVNVIMPCVTTLQTYYILSPSHSNISHG
jgi:hypothetical protein